MVVLKSTQTKFVEITYYIHYTSYSCFSSLDNTIPSRKRVHLILGLDWGWGYQCCSYTRKSAQVNYPQDLHNSNSSCSYFDFSLNYASMVTDRGQERLAVGPILHCVLLMAAVLSGRGYDRSFVLTYGMRLIRLGSASVLQVILINLTSII